MNTVDHSKHQIAPVPFAPVEGSGSEHFSQKKLIVAAIGVPLVLNVGLGLSLVWYPVLAAVVAVPVFIAFHIVQSNAGAPTRAQKNLPGLPTSAYLDLKAPELQKYNANRKIPIATFFEAYFEEKIDLKGDMLEILESRYDWASFTFTLQQAGFFLSQWLPETLWHSRKQDETQVREHYDRGDDFYSWFRKPPLT
jgi:sphingolipid C9-methyltransferase